MRRHHTRMVGVLLRQCLLWGIGLIMIAALVGKASTGLPEEGLGSGSVGVVGVSLNIVVALACFLLRPTKGLWIGLILLHLLLGGFSIYAASAGVASCGCGGNIEIAPATTVLLNSTIVAGLAMSFPRSGRRPLASPKP